MSWVAYTSAAKSIGSNTIATGKSYRETSKTTKESEAKRLLKKREGEISEGKIPGVYFDRIKFNDLV